MHYPTTPNPKNQHADWALNAYREHFYAYYKSQAQKRITELSAQYGAYVYIKRQGLGYYHAAFSQTPGSLLAEQLCLTFSNERFFIACRYLDTTSYQDALHIIIVLNGQIYAERVLAVSSLDTDEFNLLSLWDYPFKLMLIDMADQDWAKTIESMPFFKPYLASASHYDTKTLLQNPSINTTLVPIEIAQEHCPSPRYIPLALGLLSSLILSSLLFSMFKTPNTIITAQPVETMTSTPYSAYQEAISTHLSVHNVFDSIQNWLTTLLSVHGWQLRQIDFHDSVLLAQLERDPNISGISGISGISNVRKRLGASLQIDGNTLSLTRSLRSNDPAAQVPLSPLLDTQVAFMDELNHYLHQANVQFSPKQANNDCQHAPMRLRLNEGTLIEWQILAKLLMRYPVTIEHIQVMPQGNTLPIELNAELWGTR